MKPLSFHSFHSPWHVILWVLTALAFVAALLLPTSAGAAAPGETVGAVAKKRMDVYGTPPDGDRARKFPRYDVVYGELIETDGGGAVLIRLLDKTELYLGERAKLTIDEFVYDPESQQGSAVFEFTIGTLRFVSGAMEGKGVAIQTPNAYIGIRGSEAIIFVTPEGETFVNVFKGRFSVRDRDRPDRPAVNVGAGRNVSVSRGAGFSAVGKGVKVPEYTHDPGAKVPDYSDDLKDVEDGGGLDSAREGRDAGDRGGDGHDREVDDHPDHD